MVLESILKNTQEIKKSKIFLIGFGFSSISVLLNRIWYASTGFCALLSSQVNCWAIPSLAKRKHLFA